MTSPPSAASERARPPRITLRVKLVVAVLSLGVVLCAFLLGYLGPHAEQRFLAASEGDPAGPRDC